MKVPQASRIRAAISGLALGFITPLIDLIQRSTEFSPSLRNALVVSVVAAFFIAPVVLFVVGVDSFSQSATGEKRTLFCGVDRQIAIRAFCWFFGGGLAFAVLSAIHNILR